MARSNGETNRGYFHYVVSFSCRIILPSIIYVAAWMGFAKAVYGFVQLDHPPTFGDKSKFDREREDILIKLIF